jgi:hypothetical protein
MIGPSFHHFPRLFQHVVAAIGEFGLVLNRVRESCLAKFPAERTYLACPIAETRAKVVGGYVVSLHPTQHQQQRRVRQRRTLTLPDEDEIVVVALGVFGPSESSLLSASPPFRPPKITRARCESRAMLDACRRFLPNDPRNLTGPWLSSKSERLAQ